MRLLLACLLMAASTASAHGALELNEFDTYAISDFEGQEESFAWEGWEIWDIYAGDGHNALFGSHGVYFKANLAGDGTLRPLGGQTWEVRFTFAVGNQTFQRTVVHDGTEVTTDFEQLEWQLADGNVFQLHAWVPTIDWQDQAITDLVVTSLVDGQVRDTAPGGIHDPITGTEIPFAAPATPVFPAMGEGRIVEAVPLTGSAKFLDVSVAREPDGWFAFEVTNPMATQGQHFLFGVNGTGWQWNGAPDAQSLDAGNTTSFRVQATATDPTTPLRFDLMTDIGGLRSYYAYTTADGVAITEDAALAVNATPAASEGAAAPLGILAIALAIVSRRR